MNKIDTKALREKILDLAMRGKLVPQDPNDEPASVLLENIKQEKEQLLKEKVIKKQKTLPPIEKEEEPFEIPSSWEWVRLGDIAANIPNSIADGPFGSNLKKEHYTINSEVRIIQLSNIGEFGWRNKNKKYTTYSHLKLISRSEVKPGDIVISKMMPAGRAIIAANKLRDKVLDCAMRGKLVPQDPNDELASELLKRIEAEKENLIKNKVIKKQKSLPPIEGEEEPFDIPSSWEWVRLGDIGIWGAGSTPNRKRNDFYEQGTIPWVKTGDLNNGFITHQNIDENITELALEECSFTPIYKNNILIAMYGATIGKLAISNEDNLMVSNQACCVGKLIDKKMNILYIYYGLKAFNKSLIKQGVGGAKPNISRQKIISFLLPLPPLQEQKRIISKIEEIFSYLEIL